MKIFNGRHVLKVESQLGIDNTDIMTTLLVTSNT